LTGPLDTGSSLVLPDDRGSFHVAQLGVNVLLIIVEPSREGLIGDAAERVRRLSVAERLDRDQAGSVEARTKPNEESVLLRVDGLAFIDWIMDQAKGGSGPRYTTAAMSRSPRIANASVAMRSIVRACSACVISTVRLPGEAGHRRLSIGNRRGPDTVGARGAACSEHANDPQSNTALPSRVIGCNEKLVRLVPGDALYRQTVAFKK